MIGYHFVNHLILGRNLNATNVSDVSSIPHIPYRGKKTGHKINRVKLLVGRNFSHLHIKLVAFPRLNFGF